MAGPAKICLLGGAGFVGSRLASRLAALGHDLVIPTRNIARRRHLLVLPTARVLQADVGNPSALAAVLAGCTVVVNLVGILNEPGRSGAGFETAHSKFAAQLVQACESAGITKLVQISALQASATAAPSHYLRSKGEAERIIRESARLRWTILQPSVIFGPGDSFTNRFGRLLKRMPCLFPLAMPGARFAPVHVDDVVEAILRSIGNPSTDGRSYQLCGPQQLTLRAIVIRIARALGLRRLVLGLPVWASRLQARIMDFVPGKPFSIDNFLSLTVASVCTENGMAALGIQPRSFDAHLASALSGVLTRTRLDTTRQIAGRLDS